MIKTVTSQSFKDDVLSSDQPVLVDFWASWCGPCIAMEPTIEAVAKEFDGKVTVAKLNVDENPDIANQFGVQGIPTMFVFKGGQPVERIVGLTPKDKLVSVLSTATA
ncbi:MAG TPA: thioredoxin [Candidatus Saccharimonadia bacterium]